MADAKMIFTAVDNASNIVSALALSNSSIPVVAIKTNQRDPIPDGMVDLAKLMDLSGKDTFEF